MGTKMIENGGYIFHKCVYILYMQMSRTYTFLYNNIVFKRKDELSLSSSSQRNKTTRRQSTIPRIICTPLFPLCRLPILVFFFCLFAEKKQKKAIEAPSIHNIKQKYTYISVTCMYHILYICAFGIMNKKSGYK